MREKYTIEGKLCAPTPNSQVPPGSVPDFAHYSFYFAQQVHYPHNPLQPGPMYFKTARKCAVFGVCYEGIPHQVNYLIDEASETGKGANTVVSLLHHFLEHHGLGEVNLHLHADNCSGQNKNNTVLQVHTRHITHTSILRHASNVLTNCIHMPHSCQPSRNGRDSPGILGLVPVESHNVPEFMHRYLAHALQLANGLPAARVQF